MIRPLIFVFLAGLLPLLAAPPNIVLIMTDDQGYWDTGISGNPHISTPHMDRIAREGVQFTRFYAAPVCAPTRAGVMTGRYYLRTGLYNTRFGGDTLGKDEITVAQLLKRANYRTGLFGKWHLGKYHGYQPQQRGFDEFLGHYHGHIERYEFADQLVHNGTSVKTRGYVSELFTDAAMDFISATHKQTDQPFLCTLMFNAPHSPWVLDTSHYGQPEGDKLLTKFLAKKMPIREARIYALIERVDQNIGRLLAHLKTLGIERDTLVIFMSDNGGVSKFWKGGLRGNKGGVHEGGVRSPFYARWPGTIPAGNKVEAQTSHVDLLPTFCELAEAPLPKDRQIDGKSFATLLKTGRGKQHQPYVYHTWDRYTPNPDKRWSVSDQRWKLVGLFTKTKPDPTKWQLYDLQADPGETKNIAGQHPAEVRRLRKAFTDWFSEVTAGQTYRPVPIPVGHDMRPVELQPSWATCTGPHINYTFDGYDWDTIDSWKTQGEQAVWQLEVAQAGRYAVTLRYGCAPLEAGGTLLLSAKSRSLDHKVRATVTAEQFSQFPAGTLNLPAGRTTFKAAIHRAGPGEFMRLNGIHLQRLPNSR